MSEVLGLAAFCQRWVSNDRFEPAALRAFASRKDLHESLGYPLLRH